MFGFVADLLTSGLSILLPVFFSYKALRTGDPANLTPWLIYWTTLNLFLLAESHLYFILGWVPFYSWLRLFLHLYLIIPAPQQGTTTLYFTYIQPFLAEHERSLDKFIAEAHARAQTAGLEFVKQAVEYVRVKVLGLPPTPPPARPAAAGTGRNASYATQLFNRFAMPSASGSGAPAASAGIPGLGANSSDLLNLLGRAMQQPTSSSSARSAPVIPPDLQDPADRADYIALAREKLNAYLRAVDTVAADEGHLSARSAGADLSRSRSESEFEDLGGYSYHDSAGHDLGGGEGLDLAYGAVTPTAMPDPTQFLHGSAERDNYGAPPPRPGGLGKRESSSWSKWVWGDYGEKDSASGAVVNAASAAVAGRKGERYPSGASSSSSTAVEGEATRRSGGRGEGYGDGYGSGRDWRKEN